MSENQNESDIMPQLTAYLDGELESHEVHAVEQRLASDEKFRSKLQQMQKTWDVLDVLPPPSAGPSFTRSTMELVIDDAKLQAKSQSSKFWVWPLRILAIILVPFAAAAGAYMANHYVKSKPNRELQKQLNQIRDFDVYNHDQNISMEFLESLADEPSLFGVSTSKAMENEERYRLFADPPSQLSDLSSISIESKNQIRINRANFERADAQLKNRVALLTSEIDQHPQSDLIKQVLFQYHYWLRGITDTQEAELFDLKDPALRIAKIKSIVEEQVFSDFAYQLPKSDFAIMKRMLFDVLQRRENEIQRVYADNFGIQQLIEVQLLVNKNGLSEKNQKIVLAGKMLKKLAVEKPEAVDQIITASDVESVKFQLSPQAHTELEWALEWQISHRSESALITNWLLATFDAVFNKVTPDNLIDVFESLTPAEQEQLNNEFPADREQILRQIYRDNYQDKA